MLCHHWRDLQLFTFKAITGWLCYGSVLCLVVFSLNYFRRKYYNGFFIRSHWIFILFFLVFGWLHNAILIQIGTVFILIDNIIRVVDNHWRSTKITKIRMLDFDRVIRLEFEKKHFKYRAGQFIFLRVPAIGLFEWHPFSISSHPDPASRNTFSLHIKASIACPYQDANGWSVRLCNFMKE